MKIKIIILFVVFTASFQSFAQVNETSAIKEQVYTDYVADDNGNRLSGITVRNREKGITTKTNRNGVFKIKASIGDVIVLSKNGILINSYVYNGSSHYEVEDNSGYFSVKSKSISKNQFDIQLDSANYFKQENPFKSISFVENALKSITTKRGNSTKLAEAYAILGDIYLNLKQYDLAVSNYKISIKNKTTKAVNLKLARAHTLNNNIEESMTILNALVRKNMTIAHQVEVYEALGVNYKLLNKLDAAILNTEKALQISKDNSLHNKISELNADLGELYMLEGDVTKAQNIFDESIEKSKKEPLNKRAIITNSVANQYKKQQNFDKEIELKKRTLQELEDADVIEIEEDNVEEKITVQQLSLDIGNAYANKKSFSKAIDYLEKSKVDATKVSDIETKKEAVQKLSEIYKNVGDFNKALNSYQEYVGLVDLLYQKKENEIAEAVALSNNLREKQNRINSLEKDRELLESKYKLFESEQQVTVENYKRQQLIIYSLVGGLFLLLAAIYFMYKSNKQRRLTNNLLALKSLRSQMNPHFIFNALNSVNSFIAQNDERTANRYLTEFSTLMRTVLDNSEEDFIPLSKEIEMLELYLKLEHSRFKDKFDYEFLVDEDIVISEYQIPPMLLQPYVENAVWHGLRYKKEKGTLKVSVHQLNEDSICIEILDDGIGRKKSKELKTLNQKKQQSKGMDNIKRRVAILNEMYQDRIGVLITDLNENNSGTKVVLTLKKEEN